MDSYLDIVDPGSFTKTIAHLTQTQKQSNNPYLCLYLWQHDKHSPIGGIKGLTEDSHGVIYEAKINMNVQKGREAFALVEEQQVGGSSYGYDPSVFYYTGDIRHLKEITLHEVSVVSFPANPHARTLSVKSRNTSAGRIDELANKMNASFNELDRNLKVCITHFQRLTGSKTLMNTRLRLDVILPICSLKFRNG